MELAQGKSSLARPPRKHTLTLAMPRCFKEDEVAVLAVPGIALQAGETCTLPGVPRPKLGIGLHMMPELDRVVVKCLSFNI